MEPIHASFSETDWNFANYGLHLAFSRLDLDRLNLAYAAMWSHPTLEGCYSRNDVEPSGQSRRAAVVDRLGGEGDEIRTEDYGLARISSVGVLPCAAVGMYYRPEDGIPEESGFLRIGFILEMLRENLGTKEADSRVVNRLDEIDQWLLQIARWVYEQEPFEYGEIGWEVYGDTASSVVAGRGPESGWVPGLLIPKAGQLEWLPERWLGPPPRGKRRTA